MGSGNQAAVEAFHPSRKVSAGGQTFHLSIPTEEAESNVLERLSEAAEGKAEVSHPAGVMAQRRLSLAMLQAVLPDVEEDSLRALVRADVDLEPLYDAARRLLGMKVFDRSPDAGGEDGDEGGGGDGSADPS